LWAINGGRLVELHRDWAVLEVPPNDLRRVFDRRRLDPANATVPWRLKFSAPKASSAM
jgi:hypothetical protein